MLKQRSLGTENIFHISPTDGALSGEEEVGILRLQDGLTHFVERMSLMDGQFQCLEKRTHDGQLVWKIDNFTEHKYAAVAGRTMSLVSQPFYTGSYGYKMCGRLYPNGDGVGKGSHVSFYFVLMKGSYDELLQWPFRQNVRMMLVDQRGNRHVSDSFRSDPTSSSFRRPESEFNIATGFPLFVTQSQLESYLVNDVIFLRIEVDTTGLFLPWLCQAS